MNKSFPQRLDQIVSQTYNITRNQASKLIKNSKVLVNKRAVLKPSSNIFESDEIEVLELKITQDFEVNTDFEVEVIYEDDHILVINKPPNLVVHKAPSVKEATLVDWLQSKGYPLSTLNDDNNRLGIVHRIDKETSGVLVVAKTNEAHQKLNQDFKEHKVDKFYLMLTDLPLKESLIIERPIGRNSNNRLKKAIVQGGKEARTAFANLISEKGKNLVAAKLYTGRTHQIRVHLQSINRHILNDNLYGFKSKNSKMPRFMLHSYILAFNHPITNKPLEFRANLWSDFLSEIKNIDKGKVDEKISCVNSIFNDTSDWLCIK